jgi:NAD-dependent dihydropyrimidine dehydrogenase PreA subunit
MHQLASLNQRSPENLSPLLKFLNFSHSDILDHFPEGVFLVNTRWQIMYFNRMAEEITGYRREEVMGKFCWDAKKTVEVNEIICKGCGSCMATCPKQGIYVAGFSLEQLEAQVDAALAVA